VDYTLKKYVRKPRGAAKGTALYTHEKTLHVEGD
jgi:predicted ribosome quality control (RQC) complex YloA/Tae2 family protein